jgi:LPS-assembly lipoprotein
MSSHDRHERRVAPSPVAPRRAVLLALALGPALLAGGCFRPMYASVSPGAPALTETLASIEVTPIRGRVGQQVRNNLQFGFTGGGGAAVPQYRLDVVVEWSRASSIVDVDSDAPQIDTVLLTASYALFQTGNPAPLLSGRLNSSKSFDRTLQRFAALRAARDAENSAAKVLAEQIRNRIAIFLSEKT